jgi:hypothetical protein
MQVNLESCQSIHFGVNFVFAPAPALDPPSAFTFLRNLQDEGVDFPSFNRSATSLSFIRAENPLDLQLNIVGPQVAQLLLRAQFPKTGLETFNKEGAAVCKAYLKTWDRPAQFVVRDAAIHRLYSCDDCDHAFRYIWEHLLGQRIDDTDYFGKPLWGGGLRFVMPATPQDKPEPTGAEVKIESFLPDTSKLFVETHLTWPTPVQEDMFEKCSELMDRVEEYIKTRVLAYVTRSRA